MTTEGIDFEAWASAAVNGTFEEAMAGLEEMVRFLDAGNLSLDASVRCYELGVLLARRCETLLDGAELRITQIELDGNGD